MSTKFLDNSPLYSVVLELRFTAKIPEDAVTGVFYSKLSSAEKEQINILPLPASQLPLALRQQNPNLKYAPTQRLIMPNKTINIGSNVLSLEANNGLKDKSYPGWPVFFEQFKTIIRMADFITSVERVGLRYVNMFHEENFLNQLKIKLKTGWEDKGKVNNDTITFFVERNALKAKVTIATEATIEDESGVHQGQVIDLDTFVANDVPLEDLEVKVDEAHKLAKEIFYSLPGDKLLAKMGPHEA